MSWSIEGFRGGVGVSAGPMEGNERSIRLTVWKGSDSVRGEVDVLLDQARAAELAVELLSRCARFHRTSMEARKLLDLMKGQP